MPPSSTRRVAVAPERLQRWLDGFAERHGEVRVSAYADRVELLAGDGATAVLHVPFPPLAAHGTRSGGSDVAGGGSDGPSNGSDVPPRACGAPYAGIVGHALTDRRVGVLLVRLGGYAAGVFDGTRLVASKVGSRQVHGRSAAGGQSQQRFARRREGQARVALAVAADTAARVLLPHVAGDDAAARGLDAVVVGGDRRALESVLADPRLAALRDLVAQWHLDIPDPRRAVLDDMPRRFRAVHVDVSDSSLS